MFYVVKAQRVPRTIPAAFHKLTVIVLGSNGTGSLEALLVYALGQLNAPRTVRVGDQALLVSLNRLSKCLDVLFLEAVLMQRLQMQNLLEQLVQDLQEEFESL